jgi:GAF domain-containing protein
MLSAGGKTPAPPLCTRPISSSPNPFRGATATVEDSARSNADDVRFAASLREALSLAESVGTIGARVTHSELLQMIVATAAQVLRARAGALLLVDEDTEELVFEVAVGGEAEDVKKFRVPVGHGIAGHVAVTGQPIAVSEAATDPRMATDIADRVGYRPDSILCVPLFYDDEVIGVLELLDKEDGSSFTAADIESLGLFANQAAVAIEQSRVHASLGALIGDVLRTVGDGKELQQTLESDASAFAGRVEQDPTSRDALALAQLVHEIAKTGEREAQACRAILESFAEYLRARRTAGSQ